MTITGTRRSSPDRPPPGEGNRSTFWEGAAPERRRSRLVASAAVVVGFLVLVAILYVAARHAFVGDSDGATVVLEGQAMSTGHLTLHGWALSLDSFWTVDAAAYMLVELVTGMRDQLVFLVPAMIAASVIVVGALLARDGRRGIGGAAAAATVVVVLGLPSHGLAVFFLRGPLHVGTALLCLIAFAGLRSGRFGWGWVAAVLCLAAGVLGDFQMVVLGAGSVVVAGIVAMLRMRDWRSGTTEVSAAVAGLVLAAVGRALSDLVGTFAVNTEHPRASVSQMVTNLRHLPSWGANMLGVGGGRLGSGGVPAPLQAAHLIVLFVVIGGITLAAVVIVGEAIRGQPSPVRASGAWRLDNLLVVAVLADLVVFVVYTSSDDPAYMRYLTAAVIFGTVLAGRAMGRLAEVLPTTLLAWTGTALGLVLIASFGFTVTAPTPTQPYAQLDRFLEGHGLRVGIGDYWSASITTVATDGKVTVRPVITTPSGRVVRYQRQSTVTWYANRSFDFLVYDTARPWGGVDATTASLTFGPVARIYVVGSYRVLVWGHPLSIPATGFAPVPVRSHSA